MTGCSQVNEKIKENEIKAIFFMEKSCIDAAERILKKNARQCTCSTLTYDLLIKIYDKKQDFHSLIDTLNKGIKNTPRSHFYRKLKKQVIISKIISGMPSD